MSAASSQSASPGDDRSPSGGTLLSQAYSELRALAARKLAQEKPGQTLQATALVHEAWLRVAAGRNQAWQNRTQFFATAAEAMRRILIDNARRKRALRHGGSYQRVYLDDSITQIAAPAEDDDEMLAVHEALDRLTALDPEKAEVVKLKYFAGLTTAQVAEALGISEPTVKRHWAYARAWLYRAIKSGN